MVTIWAFKAPHMEPQPHGTRQDGQVADASRLALFHAGAARLTSGTHEVSVSTFEMYVELLRADDLVDDLEFWQIE